MCLKNNTTVQTLDLLTGNVVNEATVPNTNEFEVHSDCIKCALDDGQLILNHDLEV